MGARPVPVAVGSLPRGGWVGLQAGDDGFRLVVGHDGGTAIDGLGAADRRPALVALAIVFFEEALESPPAGIDEATHRELASLVRWLASTAPTADERKLAGLALDAVEDGLPGDAVALRLMALLARLGPAESAGSSPPEALELVLARARALSGG